MLIGLTLIAIIGLYACVTEAFVITGTAIAVILIGSFVAGAVSGFLIDRFFTTTVHEEGVELGDFIYDVAVEWETDYNNTRIMFDNDYAMLNAMLRYYWSKKAEYVGQAYINETTFPTDTVLTKSGLLTEYMNFSRAKVDSLDNLLGSLNDFTDSTLVNFGTLNVYASSNISDAETYALKEHQYMTAYWYCPDWTISDSTPDVGTTEYHAGNFTYDNQLEAVMSKDKALVLINSQFNSNTPKCTMRIKIYDSEGTSVYNSTVTDMTVGTTAGEVYYKAGLVSLGNMTHGKSYILNYTVGYDKAFGSWKNTIMLPLYLYPSNNDLADDIIIHVASDKALDSHYTAGSTPKPYYPLIEKLEYKNDSTVQKTTVFDDLDSLKSVFQCLTSRMEQAIASAKSYWSYLRALGYSDINDVPANYIIPTPSMVYFDSDVTDKLTLEQLQAIYVAYLRGYADFVTSSNYREVNVTASDIKLSDLSLVFNTTAYNSYGNVTYWDTKLAFLMPTTANLVLNVGANNTLTQVVQAFVFTDWNKGEAGELYELQKDNIVYVHEVYEDGIFYNTTKVTIKVKTLGQVATIYDFSLLGDPTYSAGVTDFTSLIATIVPALIIIMLVSRMFQKKRK